MRLNSLVCFVFSRVSALLSVSNVRNKSKGFCLYKMGCKGPTTYNACSTIQWNAGTSFPIRAGHGCIGCSEEGFWDKGSFYNRLTNIPAFGVEANADKIGGTAAVVAGAAIAAHAAMSMLKKASSDKRSTSPTPTITQTPTETTVSTADTKKVVDET